MGRQQFFFYRHTDIFTWALFAGFSAIPFVYEMRAILDWSCTPTTLRLIEWLKLEDIRAWLYRRECDLRLRQRRKVGDTQPLSLKIG